jgi:hypothetical protein
MVPFYQARPHKLQKSMWSNSLLCSKKRPHAKTCGRSKWAMRDSKLIAEITEPVTTHDMWLAADLRNGAKTGAAESSLQLEWLTEVWKLLADESRAHFIGWVGNRRFRAARNSPSAATIDARRSRAGTPACGLPIID